MNSTVEKEIEQPKEQNLLSVVTETKLKHPLPSTWPEPLTEEAYHGLVGDMVRTIEPRTEADPAAILLSILTLFGNCIGRKAYFEAEADKHYMNLYIGIVGQTAKARKGVSLGVAKSFFSFADDWMKNNFADGLSTGEGLIWAVRDPQTKRGKGTDGSSSESITEDGIDDKRLMVIESEFASLLKVLSREGNTLSAIIRKAWDSGDLQALAKNQPAKTTGAHISLIAHITEEELLRYLNSTEYANGFGNRFLWVCAKRSKRLSEGGNLHELNLFNLKKQLELAIEYGKTVDEIKRDEEAKELWRKIYPELSEGEVGLCGSLLARSEAQVMRLACIYALLDKTNLIKRVHLEAALSVWKYCEASVRSIFGESSGEPEADKILAALIDSGEHGMTRTEISKLFDNHKKSPAINKALNFLKQNGLAYGKKDKTGGRSTEIWYEASIYRIINNPFGNKPIR